MRFVLVLFLFASSPLFAQTALTPLVIDNATAQQHLLPRVPLHMPPIAVAAHVYGEVITQVGIDPSGHVGWVVVLSGPPMLQGAGITDSFNLVFTPFTQNNQPVYATVVIGSSYGPHTRPWRDPKADAFWGNFQVLAMAEGECNEAETGKAKPAQVAKHCKGLVKAADQMNGKNQQHRVSAYIRASGALFRNNQLQDALDAADKAVALATPGLMDSASIALAYSTRGQAEAALQNLPKADNDLTMAEEAERGAIATILGETSKAADRNTLKTTLQLHAQVLTAMGNVAAAQTKTDEAAKL